MDKPYKIPYKIIYNPILKEKIFLNKESFDIYQKKINDVFWQAEDSYNICKRATDCFSNHCIFYDNCKVSLPYSQKV